LNADKEKRQKALLGLVRSGHADSQQELVEALVRQGLHATQASVSRDIRELGVLKVGGRYALAPPAPRAQARPPVEAQTVVSISPVGSNLLVIKTAPGGAPIAASFLDRARRPELVGSVAGDDTIFLATRSRADQGRLMLWLKGFIQRKAI
jgi:transcriptional regulator of arginine metabolism